MKGAQLMTKRDNRNSDTDDHSWFRTDRFFEHEGQWFFLTREGSTEGPFGDEFEARAHLEAYIKVLKSGVLDVNNDVFQEWGLEPNES